MLNPSVLRSVLSCEFRSWPQNPDEHECLKGTVATAGLSWDFLPASSKRISEEYFLLEILLELLIENNNNN